MARDAFISHAGEDREIAESVCAALEEAGHRCWIAPRDIEGGQKWGAKLVEAVDESRVLVLIFTEHANRAGYVVAEVREAFERGRPIVPLRYDRCVPAKDLKLYIAGHQWVQMHEVADAARAARVVEIVAGVLRELDAATKDSCETGQPIVRILHDADAARAARLAKAQALLGIAAALTVLLAAGWYFRGALFPAPPAPELKLRYRDGRTFKELTAAKETLTPDQPVKVAVEGGDGGWDSFLVTFDGAGPAVVKGPDEWTGGDVFEAGEPPARTVLVVSARKGRLSLDRARAWARELTPAPGAGAVPVLPTGCQVRWTRAAWSTEYPDGRGAVEEERERDAALAKWAEGMKTAFGRLPGGVVIAGKTVAVEGGGRGP